ncbi:MotA/TolQ/ExbB proton channel family protein [Blastopirellula marina]|uniref:MotA/TolQ/ExbB proton channel family protein n=1 Tax=Blastopirellula marina TaxID=124 RepID=A0A2S8F142_9BACT|nr:MULTISPECIES: MotA/TolQ/ExbB proton channel family protein [Pirellulaceae]PQO25853.1 MotA/TolQ/ExbB proton channel family protein [Blastopirellula marina]RCS44209.1 MotA/TolQ/ExbB proton channel family protein [Bremerella cremea]
MDITKLTEYFAASMYVALGLIALWGAYCVTMIWVRVAQKRFRSEAQQDAFLDAVEEPLERGDFQEASELCESDPRALPQLAYLAIENREIGYAQVRQLVVERFQRDVLADLDHRISWVNTVIKGAPMVGLLGTVTGMMGAFGKLAAAEQVKASDMANDISLALVTTALGLVIAIPLTFCLNSVNIRIRKMEDLVAVGLTRFMGSLREAIATEAMSELEEIQPVSTSE